jgi:hypothetical protein
MRGKHRRWWRVLVLCAGLLLPATSQAGPYIGDFGYCWKPAKDCPKGQYSFLHYWVPLAYLFAHELFPVNIDQYPPGLPVEVSWAVEPSPCRTAPPLPTPAYADPAAFFGRPVLPEAVEAKDTKQP